MADELMTKEEVATFVKVAPKTVQRRIDSQELPVQRDPHGRIVRIWRSDACRCFGITMSVA